MNDKTRKTLSEHEPAIVFTFIFRKPRSHAFREFKMVRQGTLDAIFGVGQSGVSFISTMHRQFNQFFLSYLAGMIISVL